MKNCSFEDFSKIELKIGEIIEAHKIPSSDKLLKLIVNIGEEKTRQIIAGIGKSYNPEELINSEIVIVSNLEPKTFSIHGEDFESQGMLLATSDEDGVVLLEPRCRVFPGASIK